MSADDALKKFFAKHAKQLDREMNGPSRKNEKPEIELTQKPCMIWFKANGFSMDVIESKAVFNYEAGRYVSGQTAPGVSDSFGCTPCGFGCFVEFKAPGKRATLKKHQREWLLDKIKRGAFAVCVDSVECLEKVWNEYSHARKMNFQLGINVLLRHLPHATVPREKPAPDDLPF